MILGIDTSNYTTSAAVLDGEALTQQKQLLEVRPGERGLRQSDALFQHTRNLPLLFDKLPPMDEVTAVGVSTRPRNVEGSYMPCFLAGISAATAAAKAAGCPLYTTSHQVGHILAALYGAGALEMIRAPFVAFHVSGGTTEALLVEPHKEELISARCVAASSDLKAGQLIDRTGVRLGLQFPCGPALEQLALQSRVSYKINPQCRERIALCPGWKIKWTSACRQGMHRPILPGLCSPAYLLPYKVWCRLCLPNMASCRCCSPVA